VWFKLIRYLGFYHTLLRCTCTWYKRTILLLATSCLYFFLGTLVFSLIILTFVI
jgi:hypothetical protein